MEIDLAPIIELALQFIGAILALLLSRAALMFARKLGVEVDSIKGAILDTAISQAVQYGSNYVRDSLDTSGRDKAMIKNLIVAEALNYAIARVPDTIEHFKITPKALAEMIEARIWSGELDELTGPSEVGFAPTASSTDA